MENASSHHIKGWYVHTRRVMYALYTSQHVACMPHDEGSVMRVSGCMHPRVVSSSDCTRVHGSYARYHDASTCEITMGVRVIRVRAALLILAVRAVRCTSPMSISNVSARYTPTHMLVECNHVTARHKTCETSFLSSLEISLRIDV